MIAVPVLLVPLLPGWWAWGAAAVWLGGWTALLASEYRAAPGPDSLEFARELPAKSSIGVPNPVRLTVTNRSARGAVLFGRETPPAGFEGERRFGAVAVPPHDESVVTLHFTPVHRGAYRFGDPGIRSMGPLGLAGRQFVVPLAEECRVYPDILAVQRYALLARKGTLYELGIRATRYTGAGTEFESLRDYQHGDDYRDIDWKATARRAHPVVRRFEVERSQTIILAVDAGRLMQPVIGGLSKLDRAVNAALLLAYLATQGGDLVGLLVFGRDVHTFLPPKKGHRQFLAVLEALYSVEGKTEESDYARALTFLSTRLSRRSLVVLFTDVVGQEPSRRLIGVLKGLMPRHLPLLITQRNRDIERRARGEVGTETDAFGVAVAEDVLRDKAEALSVLASRGALILDVDPDELSVAAVNRYLEVKARGRL
jgi:uncharacterized protein (DUF58 family)